MQERDVFDLLLVAVLAIVTYVEWFGLSDPTATADQILATLATIDITVYLVFAGLFGILFVGYITVYLPRKDAEQSIR